MQTVGREGGKIAINGKGAAMRKESGEKCVPKVKRNGCKMC